MCTPTPTVSNASNAELADSVVSVLHFEDPALLRATRLSDVLHRSGHVFATSAGTESTYRLSSQAQRIDVFVSHNWAVGRAYKFVLLAMHFNLSMAIQAALAVTVMAGCLVYWLARLGYIALATFGAFTPTCSMAAFFIALFFGHEVKALLGMKGELLFVDRLCIHQTDEVLKRGGIRNLGAFLHHSDALLVCFTELYLRRLWTVYEFATFLLVHGEACSGAVHVVPTNLPILVIAGVFLLCIGLVLNRVGIAAGIRTPIFRLVTSSLTICMLVRPLRAWSRQRREADAAFQRFVVADTACVLESDRALVSRNIVALAKHFSLVPADSCDEDAFQAFDEFVRTAGADAFRTSVGGLGCPYKMLVPVQLPTFADAVDWWAMAVGQRLEGHQSAAQAAYMLAGHSVKSFAVLPLACAVGLYLAKHCLGARRVAELLYCGVVAVSVCVAFEVLDPIDGLLQPWILAPAVGSQGSPVPFLMYALGLSVLTAFVYRPPRRGRTTWLRRAARAAEAEANVPVASGDKRDLDFN